MYGKYLNLTNDTTKVAKSHSHCQNCLQVSRLQSLCVEQPQRGWSCAGEAGRRGGSSARPGPDVPVPSTALQNALRAKIAQRLVVV